MWIILKSKIFFIFICFSMIFYYFYFFEDFDSSPDHSLPSENFETVINLNKNETKNVEIIEWMTFDQCKLSPQNSFNSALDLILPEKYNLFENCTPVFKKLSTLINGTLIIDEKAGTCFYRCIIPTKEKGYKRESWQDYDPDSPPQPKCDFVEIRCVEGYRYGHHQIYIPPDEKTQPKNDTRPNVYIFGIDALSNQMFHRYLYRTAYWAEQTMDGVNFVYYNKVGKNSIPNQFPATFGKFRVRNENPTDFDNDYKPDFETPENLCHTKIPTSEQFISLIFKDGGYRTARIFDDDMVHDLHCMGFDEKIHDHEDYPFYSYFESWFAIRQEMHNWSCRTSAHDYFDHFMHFVDVESKKPKFVLHVIVETGHNHPEYSLSYDKYFYNGFMEKMNKFDNDFLIFWSDHGNHFGKIFDSEFGFKDTRNPLLIIIPPKRFRKNFDHPLYSNLMENSKKLTSHFDFYATLVDIATSDFSTEDFTKPFTLSDAKLRTKNRIQILHGSSLLRSLTRPNNCKSAKIPFYWCLCDYPHIIPNDVDTVILKIAPTILDILEKSFTKKKKFRDYFIKTRKNLKEKFWIREFAIKMNEGRRLFHIKIWTPKYKYISIYKTFVELSLNGTVRIVGDIE